MLKHLYNILMTFLFWMQLRLKCHGQAGLVAAKSSVDLCSTMFSTKRLARLTGR